MVFLIAFMDSIIGLLGRETSGQIPLLKQLTICDDETIYNNSNKKINKEVVTPAATTTPHSTPFQLL
jgi:hypothetical protein